MRIDDRINDYKRYKNETEKVEEMRPKPLVVQTKNYNLRNTPNEEGAMVRVWFDPSDLDKKDVVVVDCAYKGTNSQRRQFYLPVGCITALTTILNSMMYGVGLPEEYEVRTEGI